MVLKVNETGCFVSRKQYKDVLLARFKMFVKIF
jgi:hypothetical protein